MYYNKYTSCVGCSSIQADDSPIRLSWSLWNYITLTLMAFVLFSRLSFFCILSSVSPFYLIYLVNVIVPTLIVLTASRSFHFMIIY